MALSRKITEIYLREQGGGVGSWQYKVVPNDFDSDLGMVNWESPFDEALDGSLRQNFRGFRANLTLNWEKLTTSTVTVVQNGASNTIESLLEDIVTSLATNKDDGIEIRLPNDSGTNDWVVYVPEDIGRLASYTNQIGRTSSNLTFKSQQLLTTIPTYLQGPVA